MSKYKSIRSKASFDTKHRMFKAEAMLKISKDRIIFIKHVWVCSDGTWLILLTKAWFRGEHTAVSEIPQFICYCSRNLHERQHSNLSTQLVTKWAFNPGLINYHCNKFYTLSFMKFPRTVTYKLWYFRYCCEFSIF